MRNMSFALTKSQIIDQSKDVTRRLGWDFLRVGDLLQPVEKCMGLRPGEQIVADGLNKIQPGQPVRILASQTGAKPGARAARPDA